MEQPNKYYFIIRGHKLAVEADSSILTIMEKLQSYKSKVTLNFEVYSSFFLLLFFLFFSFIVPHVLFIRHVWVTLISCINMTRGSIIFFINWLCAYGAGYTV